MHLLVRLILALTMAIQSLPGLAGSPCVPAIGVTSTSTSAASAQSGICPCCAGADQANPACPVDSAASACQCGSAQPDSRPVPSSDTKANQLEHLLVLLPALAGTMLPAPKAEPATWSATQTAAHRPSNPVQSLLCVWVM